MWYLLKVEYSAGAKSQNDIAGFHILTEAQHVFAQLETGYQLSQPVRIKNGQSILVKGAWLYESFRDHYSAAVESIASGEATLIGEARGVNIEFLP